MGWNDHIPTEDDFAAVAIEAGAINVCPFHPHVTVNQGDPKATKLAYAIATNRWKAGDLLDDREDIMDGIKHAIEMAADECPVCESIQNA
jgi:hypothetical protein